MIGQGESFTTLNWAYPTVPQKHLDDRILTVNAGKALGGSSVINSMIFVSHFGPFRFNCNQINLIYEGNSRVLKRNSMMYGLSWTMILAGAGTDFWLTSRKARMPQLQTSFRKQSVGWPSTPRCMASVATSRLAFPIFFIISLQPGRTLR